MKTPHFFKAKSRIGLKNKPIHQIEFNFGVEEAPDAILETSSLENFPDYKLDGFTFSKPEDLRLSHFYPTLASQIKQFKGLINDLIKPDEIQVVVGGDHSVTLPSVLAVMERGYKKLGVIYFDSHADINLNNTSPTGNFHGMHMRPLFDKFDIPEIENLVVSKIPTTNLLYIGNLDLDSEEKQFLTNNEIRNITGDELKTNRSKIFKEITRFVNKFDHLYVSFDIDCIDQSEAPATGIPAMDGLHSEQVFSVLKLINKHPNLSFDLCEVNPKKKGAEKTIKLAQKILKTIF